LPPCPIKLGCILAMFFPDFMSSKLNRSVLRLLRGLEAYGHWRIGFLQRTKHRPLFTPNLGAFAFSELGLDDRLGIFYGCDREHEQK
jgi:hypothetical protein